MMGRPRKPSEETPPNPAASLSPDPVAAPAPQVEPFPPKDQERRQFAIYYGPDGKPDLTKLRASTRENLKAIMQDKALADALGIGAERKADLISPEVIGQLYDGLGMIEAVAASKALSIPPEKSQAIFTYSAVEKALLVPPTAAILAKYAPGILEKYGDEITLAVLLCSISYAKVDACLQVRAQIEKEKAAARPVKPNGGDADANAAGADN